jgi:phosphatidylinositol 4-kinase
LWLKPYEILGTGQRCGIIELAEDALSIDSIKKKMGRNSRIIDYFHHQFGSSKSRSFKQARQNFCSSLAAYSLLTYILQIKDRHNGNILIDIEGHLMHIDFGFFLSNAPGKGVKFEKAPFKLTAELVEVLGGDRSVAFAEYRELMKQGFLALQENAHKIIIIIEMMFMG